MSDTVELTLADLAISPLNVRFNEQDARAVEALSASIVERGLLEQLLVHPAAEGAAWAERAPDAAEKYGQQDPADFGIFAGGRRYRAIRLAVERGLLPKDFSIGCVIRELSQGEIILLSLSENLLRRELRGYEVHKAIADLRRCDWTIEQIAKDLGQSVDWVRQQARLGELAEPIFAAYCAGAIDVDQAKAYAATDDAALQLRAWEHFSRKASWEQTPPKIREFYKIGDHQLSKLLLFVGESAYCDAGGRFELDLFAGEQQHRGRVIDEGLLTKLAETQLQLTRAGIREKSGWRDLAFAAEPPQRSGFTDTSLEIYLDKPADLEGALPKGTPDSAICATIEIASSGSTIIRYWWESRTAKRDAEKGGAAKPAQKPETESVLETSGLQIGHDKSARDLVRDEHGLTTTGLQIVRSQRRDLLRAIILRDAGIGGELARDYLVFAQLRQELGDDQQNTVGLRSVSSDWQNRDDENAEEVKPWLEDHLAAAYWKSAVEDLLAKPFLSLDDPVAAFNAFVALDAGTKAQAAAVLVGLSLVRSANAPGYRVPLHDRLADLAGADASQIRRFWSPDRRFVSLFPKMKRMELAQPFVEPKALASWKEHKDVPLSEATSFVLNEQSNWVHPLVSFDFEGFEVPADEAEEREAAE